MRYKYRICFDLRKDGKELYKFLKKNNYDIEEDFTSYYKYIVAFVYEDDDNFAIIEKLIKKYNIKPGIDVVYSKYEFEIAEWYKIYSTSIQGYPQPESTYKELVFSTNEHGCYCNAIQTGNMAIRKMVTYGNKYFFTLHWGSLLFCNHEVKRVFEEKGVKGIEFRKVFIKNQQSGIEANALQMIPATRLKETLDHEKSIKNGKETCWECGGDRRLQAKEIYYKRETLENLDVDMVETKESFGFGVLRSPHYLINKKIYSIIKENKMEKNLIIEPIFYSN